MNDPLFFVLLWETRGRRAAVCFEKLDRLEMPNCVVLGDESLTSICVHCTDLLHLNISGCSAVTNAGVLAIAQHRTSLLSLNVSQLTLADDHALRAILLGCRALRQLTANGLPKVKGCWGDCHRVVYRTAKREEWRMMNIVARPLRTRNIP
jgi:hypothetical protein